MSTNRLLLGMGVYALCIGGFNCSSGIDLLTPDQMGWSAAVLVDVLWDHQFHFEGTVLNSSAPPPAPCRCELKWSTQRLQNRARCEVAGGRSQARTWPFVILQVRMRGSWFLPRWQQQVCVRLPLLRRDDDGHQGLLQGHWRWNMAVSLRVQVLLQRQTNKPMRSSLNMPHSFICHCLHFFHKCVGNQKGCKCEPALSHL